jgi:SsrA-binding protein
MTKAFEGKKVKIVADNRKARHDYEIVERHEAGIMLQGTEVKALREGKANIGESYASIEGGTLFLINAYIPQYSHANRFNHEPRQPRKLLMHKQEIERLSGAIKQKGMTLVPLTLYFNDKGRAKVELGLGKGRKAHDKRDVLKERDWQRQKERLLRHDA